MSEHIIETNRSKDVDSYEQDDFVEEDIEDELPSQNQSFLKDLQVPAVKDSPQIKIFDNVTKQVNQDLLENSQKVVPFSDDRSQDSFSNQISVSGGKRIDVISPIRVAHMSSPKMDDNNNFAVKEQLLKIVE